MSAFDPSPRECLHCAATITPNGLGAWLSDEVGMLAAVCRRNFGAGHVPGDGAVGAERRRISALRAELLTAARHAAAKAASEARFATSHAVRSRLVREAERALELVDWLSAERDALDTETAQ